MPVFNLSTVNSPFAPAQYDVWGSIAINGVLFQCPADGYFVVKGAERAFKWDIQDGLMAIGATEFFRGRTPPQFTIELYFWAASQWGNFLDMIQPFNYDPAIIAPSAKVRAVTIFHPALDAIGINQVICEGITTAEQVSDDHLWKATLKLREYFPLKPFPPQDKDTAPEQPTDPSEEVTKNAQLQVTQLIQTASNDTKTALVAVKAL